jgi:hypothetical protein
MCILGYVDPGLGLLAWQVIVSTFLGVLFYVKKTRDWIFKIVLLPFRPFQRRANPPTPPSPAASDPATPLDTLHHAENRVAVAVDEN